MLVPAPCSAPLSASSPRLLVLRVLFLLLALLGSTGCEKEKAPSVASAPLVAPPPLPSPAASLSPVRGAPVDALLFEGEVESSVFTELGFAVAGRVESVAVEEGERVRKGALLGSLDRLDRLDHLEETRRPLSEARTAARSGGGSASSRGQLPAYLRAEIEKRLRAAEADGADVSATRRALLRAGRLEGREGMTRVLGSRAYRVGKKSRAQHRYIEDRTADERLAVALIDSLEHRERRLERELKECELLSPIDGLVVMIRAREGQSVQTRGADAAFVLIDPSDLIVRLPVPEKLAKILGPGEDAWLEFGDSGASGEAKVLRVESTAYSASGTPGATMRDVLVAPEAGLLGRLRIGDLARVALRR